MEFNVINASLTEQKCDVLIINLFEGVQVPGGGTGAVDTALDGAVSEVIRDEEFKGKLGDAKVIRTCGKIPAKHVMLIGLGKREKFGVVEIMRASASAARKCNDMKAKSVASILHGAGIGGMNAYDCARATALGSILGTYKHIRLKTEDVEENTIETFSIVELSAEKLDKIKQGIERAEVVGESIVFARDLANEPSNVVTPSFLASTAKSMADEYGFECAIKDRKQIESAGMGLLAAVAKGASQEPRFIELKYTHPEASKTVAIIGKGITFDTGGYSLKSSNAMYGMKDDMSGAADVLGVMNAVGKLKPKLNVVALVPATENAIGPDSIHPGDVVKSYAGKNVEINNTDAEGRLILSDAVAYAVKMGVDEIIDLATLTGACVVALGQGLSGIFSNNQALADKLIAAGNSCDEKLWQLPLYDDYKEFLKSDTADIRNNAGQDGGAINAALFIASFAGDTPWAHIDLSSATFDKDTMLARKGSTGIGVGTLIEYLIGK